MRYIIILLLYITYNYATPQFAKEYSTSCSTCHSSVPVLNETGRNFLRDGFRFSYDEKTTLAKIQENSNTTYIPLSVMLSVKYNSITEDTKGGLKPFLAGTLTNQDSFFLSVGKNKNIYYQKNIDKNIGVFRVGFLSVYTQLSSINKISANTGVSCNDDNLCTTIFKTPLKKASIKSIRGLDYSYKLNNSIFLISIGNTQNNPRQKTCLDKYDVDYESKKQLSTGVSYNIAGYNLGMIYGKISDSNLTDYSIVSFLDKDFNNISLHIGYVYKKDKDFTYKGIENMISYQYNSELLLKYFYSYDEDKDYNNKSYMLGFEKNYNNLIFTLYSGKRESLYEDESVIQTSVKIYF